MEYVYFIQAEELGYIKIGFTKDPFGRLCTLQQGSPDRLIMLGIIQGNIFMEGLLHKRFSELRVRGEWYLPHISLLVFIKKYAVDPRRLFGEELSMEELKRFNTVINVKDLLDW